MRRGLTVLWLAVPNIAQMLRRVQCNWNPVWVAWQIGGYFAGMGCANQDLSAQPEVFFCFLGCALTKSAPLLIITSWRVTQIRFFLRNLAASKSAKAATERM
ncbi:MAG: hypothetical protein Q8O37_11480 [Sulfuricellaceae bacterium]|nr:hypothetical protein [Sulfuricellaceae bacterium]